MFLDTGRRLAWWGPLLLSLTAPRSNPSTIATPPLSVEAAPGVAFVDVTSAAGLASFRHVSGSAEKNYIIDATGSGAALVDYDNDGWLDAYLVSGSTWAALAGREAAPSAGLFHNNRDGTFTNVTVSAGVANGRWGQGVCAGDFDNDGWTDLYVTNYGRNRLYHNNGNGTFTDVGETAGVAVDGWSTGCAFGDYDGDGKLDLFVAGYISLDPAHLPPAPPAAGAAPRAEGTPASPPDQQLRMGAAYRPGMLYCEYRGQPVMCGPRGLKGAPDHLFRNNGDGTFTDVSVPAGVADAAGFYGFGVAFFDFDDDGKLDLFVANDSTPNYLYRNQGDGTFKDVSYSSGAALDETGREQAHMGVAIGDYDNDGRDDIHVTNFADDSNVLYHNDGHGLFSDVSYAAGIGRPSVPCSSSTATCTRSSTASTGTRPTASGRCSSATSAGASWRWADRRGRPWPSRGRAGAWPWATSTTTATWTRSSTTSTRRRRCCATTAATAPAIGSRCGSWAIPRASARATRSGRSSTARRGGFACGARSRAAAASSRSPICACTSGSAPPRASSGWRCGGPTGPPSPTTCRPSTLFS
ncbi:MAG: hypothetical protein DMF82_21555 [Acidobacteria bacterium]|nr:MAG: hypothetical protein DMF82_21555 [Acidobacteriota bacterium]